MGSSYFGEPSLGNARSGSSRKGKKSNSDKPRQPQRGLGVAQLEKIRLHNQMNCSYLPSSPLDPNYHHHSNISYMNQGEDMRVQAAYSSGPSTSSFSYSSSPSSYGFQPNIMMGTGEMDASEYPYVDSQFSTTARWHHSNVILESQYATPPSATRQFLSLQMEDSGQKNRRQDRSRSKGSSSHNSDSSETQELDLELKLSL